MTKYKLNALKSDSFEVNCKNQAHIMFFNIRTFQNVDQSTV